MEEKGSDVNLACHLVNDAWKNLFDAAIVISNDTDLAEPIRLAAQERKKRIIIASPNKFGVSPALKSVATNHRHLRLTHFRRALFDDPVAGTSIRKPPSW
ncbi:MAG: NYN domain-containing protein [Candidatus Tectomicrobia bacterium]|uniref:NYN domain-containing protein n=1 Tax=Tectimicrobiota bacterium TaxID=2528274 RepID=A0A932HYF1_UNCTE|nr:NYN domain-containing protein [Candidatus Tectomicrobia bacterium]